MAATAQQFRTELSRLLKAASARGFSAVELTAGALHRRVGGYPGQGHRMPVCCDVMRADMGPDDVIVEEPPQGKGASLKVRFQPSRSDEEAA